MKKKQERWNGTFGNIIKMTKKIKTLSKEVIDEFGVSWIRTKEHQNTLKDIKKELKEIQFNLDNETSYTKQFKEIWIKKKEKCLMEIDKTFKKHEEDLKKDEFKLKHMSKENVEHHIGFCEGKHIQQVVYSTYHRALTQICFGCKRIRTSLNEGDLKNV